MVIQKEARGREDDVELRAPFGWSVRASGKYVIAVILVLVATGVICVQLYLHDERAAAATNNATKTRDAQLVVIKEKTDKLEKSLDMLVWTSLLSDKEKSQYRILMPAAFREKLLESERNR